MIGTTGVTVLFVVNLVFAGILGIAVSGLMSLVLRRSWSLKEALLDAALAVVVAAVAAYVIAAVESARGVWESRVALMFIVASASVAVRHLVRLRLRPAS